MKTIEDILKEHHFFSDLADSDLALISGCGKNQLIKNGKYLAREGDSADTFYVVRHGKVAIETHGPSTGSIVVETLSDGDVVGWSWLFPPYKWTFDIRVLEETRLIALDGKCLRMKADADPALGYRLMKSFARVMTDRLRAARLQLINVYGDVHGQKLSP